MNFLVDECLHTSLIQVALARGHDATHVNYRGLTGYQDWNLMPIIVDEAFTFVTNNAGDFLRHFSQKEIHAGLVVIIPNVKAHLQRDLFEVVLDELGDPGDLLNQAIKVWFADDDKTEVETERLDLALPEAE